MVKHIVAPNLARARVEAARLGLRSRDCVFHSTEASLRGHSFTEGDLIVVGPGIKPEIWEAIGYCMAAPVVGTM